MNEPGPVSPGELLLKEFLEPMNAAPGRLSAETHIHESERSSAAKEGFQRTRQVSSPPSSAQRLSSGSISRIGTISISMRLNCADSSYKPGKEAAMPADCPLFTPVVRCSLSPPAAFSQMQVLS